MNNTVYSNSLYGLKINSSSQDNLVKWNDFIDNNPEATCQAFDDGTENTFTANYWFEWTTPDSDSDGIVDEPYIVEGTAQNTDPAPRALPNPNSPDITVANGASGWSFLIALMVFIAVVTSRKRKK